MNTCDKCNAIINREDQYFCGECWEEYGSGLITKKIKKLVSISPLDLIEIESLIDEHIEYLEVAK